MAIVKWNSAIDYVKGALSKPVKKEGHSHGDYLIGTHREAPTTNPNCSRAYVKGADAFKRSTPVKATEMEARMRFGEIGRAVQARMKDLSKITADQQAFSQQKDQPGGKKTMMKYLWSLEAAKYDQEHNG